MLADFCPSPILKANGLIENHQGARDHKESVTKTEMLVVNGVLVFKSYEHPMQVGDFQFRPTR